MRQLWHGARHGNGDEEPTCCLTARFHPGFAVGYGQFPARLHLERTVRTIDISLVACVGAFPVSH